MKILFIGILLAVTTGLLSQTDEWEKCGLNDSSQLNKYEAEYFNEVFKNERADFDFSEKKIAYYTGSLGTTPSAKSAYFNALQRTNTETDETVHAWQANGTQLLILTDEEKALSGGYDAILVSWSKLLKEGKSRAQLVENLKNELPN